MAARSRSTDDAGPEPMPLAQLPDATTRVVPATVVEQLELLPPQTGDDRSGHERTGPPDSTDIGRTIGLDEIDARWGIGARQLDAIHAVARRNRVTIDMHPTSRTAHALIMRQAALARPREIDLEPLDEVDVLIGVAASADIGTIAFLDPARLPVATGDGATDPAPSDVLRARMLMRRAEHARNRDAIEALAAEGRIRIESTGILVNTGLVGPAELPFTMDNRVAAVRNLDGQAVNDDVLDSVVDDLVRADTGVKRGLYAGSTSPALRVGDGSPIVVGPPPAARRADVATSVELSDPRDRRAARLTFVDLVVSHPMVEFALLKNEASGEFFIVRGSSRALHAALAMVSRLATVPSRSHISIEARSRAVEEGLGHVSERRRVPTGDDTDFAFVAATATRTTRPARGEIHFIDEHHEHAVTLFGVDPDEAQPFHIDVPRVGRHREQLRFASLDEYCAWVTSEFEVQPVAVIDSTSLPTLIDFEREPQWEHASARPGHRPNLGRRPADTGSSQGG